MIIGNGTQTNNTTGAVAIYTQNGNILVRAEWDKIALVHVATPKDKWFKEGRFINNEVKMPYSKYDYAMCYWYFNKMDDVVRLYGLDKMRDDMKILTPTDPIDMTKIELRKPKPKKDSSEDMETLW